MDGVQKEAIEEASKELSQELKTLIDGEDLESLKQSQHVILGRLQDSNAVLSHFNEYSEHCFAEVSGDFLRNTRVLRSMKSDLDYVFQKLRIPMCLFPETTFIDDAKNEDSFAQNPSSMSSSQVFSLT